MQTFILREAATSCISSMSPGRKTPSKRSNHQNAQHFFPRKEYTTDNDNRNAFVPHTGFHSTMQIWEFPADNTQVGARPDLKIKPRLRAILSWDWGDLRKMEWCPTPKDARDTDETHLGLMAGIWRDGKTQFCTRSATRLRAADVWSTAVILRANTSWRLCFGNRARGDGSRCDCFWWSGPTELCEFSAKLTWRTCWLLMRMAASCLGVSEARCIRLASHVGQ